MERENVSFMFVIALLLVLQAPSCVNAGPCSCWGGCFNRCLGNEGTAPTVRIVCGFQCFNDCVPRDPTVPLTASYCLLGCSLSTCVKFDTDGTGFGACLRGCSDSCDAI